jgi:hypothetical protein
MTMPILPPNLPVEVEREITLALLAADLSRTTVENVARGVIRRRPEVAAAWDRSLPMALRLACRAGIHKQHVSAIEESLDARFGCVPHGLLEAVLGERAKFEARLHERQQHAMNFDTAISRREARQLHRRLQFTSAAEAFARAKKGYW